MTTETPAIDTNGFLKIGIPFEGFYGSSYDAALDNWLEMEAYNLDEEGATKKQVAAWSERAFDAINWRAVHHGMAKDYLAELVTRIHKLFIISDEKPAHIVWDEMTSPREYNFDTDHIYALCSPDVADRLYAMSQRSFHSMAVFDKCVQMRHSSRSGFISFYSTNWKDEWPDDVRAWDEVQLQTLLMAALADNVFNVAPESLNDELSYHNLMSDYGCNGEIDNLIWGNVTPEFKLYDSRLRARLDRKG